MVYVRKRRKWRVTVFTGNTIVFGEKIKFWYHRKNYFSECGDLGCSCMKYDECQDYFGIYTENPDHVGMAIMVNNENKLLARCLIWYPNTKKDKSIIFNKLFKLITELMNEQVSYQRYLFRIVYFAILENYACFD